LKRYRVTITLGFIALLLAAAAAFSPAPAVRTDASGFGTANGQQRAALNDTHQGLVIRNADPLTSNFLRIQPSSPHGMVPKSIAPILPDVQGLGIADILPASTLEIGFHSLLRAPPASLLI